MSYAAFSPKQRMALTWWMPGSGESHREAIVCDGAVRSGKTMAMGLGFFLWAMMCFDGQRFGVCGKTVGSLRRNVLAEILPKLAGLGFTWKETGQETVDVSKVFINGECVSKINLHGSYIDVLQKYRHGFPAPDRMPWPHCPAD